eukprot:1196179-Prorocentrum_minimum.AAC.5
MRRYSAMWRPHIRFIGSPPPDVRLRTNAPAHSFATTTDRPREGQRPTRTLPKGSHAKSESSWAKRPRVGVDAKIEKYFRMMKRDVKNGSNLTGVRVIALSTYHPRTRTTTAAKKAQVRSARPTATTMADEL